MIIVLLCLCLFVKLWLPHLDSKMGLTEELFLFLAFYLFFLSAVQIEYNISFQIICYKLGLQRSGSRLSSLRNKHIDNI